MNFGSLGAGFGSLSSGIGGLLPTIKNVDVDINGSFSSNSAGWSTYFTTTYGYTGGALSQLNDGSVTIISTTDNGSGGTLTNAEGNPTSSIQGVQRPNVLVVGHKYKLTVELGTVTSGGLSIENGNETVTLVQYPESNKTYTLEFTAKATTLIIKRFALANVGGGVTNIVINNATLTKFSTSWIRGATEDGMTLFNSQGIDANLTGVNCIDSDNDNADNIDSQLASSPTGDWYLEMTIYPQSYVFFSELAAINPSNIFLRFRGTVGRLGARIANTSYETSVGNDVPLNEWSKVVSQRVGSNVIISAYELDGTERFSETISAESTAFANDELVFLGVSSGRHFNGYVSNIKVGNSSTDLLCHYPLAEGSGTKAYDVSGKGNHGTISGTSWAAQDNVPSWNHEYGHVPSVTFDGTDDYIASGLSPTDNFTFEFKARLGSDGDYMGSFVGVRFFTGRNNSTSVRLGYKSANLTATVDSTIFDKFTTYKIEGGKLYIDGVETIDSSVSPAGSSIGDLYVGARNFSGSADSFVNGDVAYAKVFNASGTLVRHFVPTTDGFIDLVNHTAYTNDGTGTLTTKRIPALNTKTTQVATFDGVNDKLVATGITSSSVITHDGTATLTAGTGEITSTAGTAYNIKVDGVLTFSMSQGIGTTTITSENGAIGNATATNVTLANFWGTRVADTSGSLVSADYAVGNTSISNPSGYTHNNSECGLDMVTNDKTVKQLFTIDNSTATQTFARKNNSFITQVLDYPSALTGDELTRTRKYVGS